MTQDTSGQTGSISSESMNLSISLANRLRRKTDTIGSTLYKLTWKDWDTPSGRLLPLLRASVRRTSDIVFTSWRTPQASDGEGGVKEIRPGTNSQYKLRDQIMLASWGTPTAQQDGKSPEASKKAKEKMGRKAITALQPQVAAWVSPNARDWKDTPGQRIQVGDRVRLDQLPRQVHHYLKGVGTPVVSRGEYTYREGDPTQKTLKLAGEVRLMDGGETQNGSTAQTKNSGRLAPEFSLWLMGLPIEWLNCAPSETP